MTREPLDDIEIQKIYVYSARCNIYISRLCYNVSVRLSVQLSVHLWRLCIVVTGCNGSRISLHASNRWCLCYLLTTPHPDHRMGWCRDFWWKRGCMEKLVIVALSLILLIFSDGPETRDGFFYMNDVDAWHFLFCNLGRKCIISEKRFVLELPTSRAMLATASFL